MRLNKFIAHSTGISRRQADKLIKDKLVKINDKVAIIGSIINEGSDEIEINNTKIAKITNYNNPKIIKLNKPVGYVVSKNGQGSKTIYELLPKEYSKLKPIGRLDKDSSGILLLTDNGNLIQHLTHPKYQKNKVYHVSLDRDLKNSDFDHISKFGVDLEDGLSKLNLARINDSDYINWKIIMSEGRNRQIRRTFQQLNYKVIKLHRISFDQYDLGDLQPGQFKNI